MLRNIVKKIKIRFIGLLPPPIGGVTIHTYRLFSWLKTCDDVDIKITALNDFIKNEMGVEYIGNKLIWTVKKVLFGFSEDIVHYHGSNYYGLMFLYLIKKIHNNFKLVWSIQGEHIVPDIKKKYQIFQKILLDIDTIIVANENIKMELFDLNVSSDKTICLSPFLMPLKIDRVRLLEKYKIKNKKILIFNAYRLELRDNIHDIYGFNTLIDSFKKINKNTILILLIPQMNNDEKLYFQKLLNTLTDDYRERIIHIQDEENQGWQYISESDIFIRPTITDGDALSVKEALCFGIPAVVSDCVQRPSETIKFKTSSSNDLANKINYLIENYDLEKNKLINIDFCSNSKGKQYLDLYKRLDK